jgi:hypothetical protein
MAVSNPLETDWRSSHCDFGGFKPPSISSLCLQILFPNHQGLVPRAPHFHTPISFLVAPFFCIPKREKGILGAYNRTPENPTAMEKLPKDAEERDEWNALFRIAKPPPQP